MSDQVSMEPVWREIDRLRDELSDSRAQYAALDGELSDARADRDRLQRDYAAADDLADTLSTQLTEAEQERDAALDRAKAALAHVRDCPAGVTVKEARAERDRLRTALERTLANFERVVARVPVRDVTETIAEARAALGSTTEPEETRKRPLLGHATTRELLTEIKARGEVSHTIGEYPEEMGSMAIGAANILDGLPGSMLDYRTVGAEPEETEK